ncbi:glutamyl-tRNA(Gln) amidotransferase subunit C [Spiroplasma sabaudiense Ar-1343]|uniref:Glutamyl-tRNA(Gln) amidotransferase subunit C n=1 Tax=Spiroplasma sabaudiense Ar-1343 TaxID=1276257 RepID=W6A9F9_9MOLU|nr:Asp-tRNA(Asn)/Glu-tRNA(Gln) amidotransferase subunit GatC [Spiroplasma sabaudiense]AHI53520.1 glutamyl-tRNA(Gln) amidotransferase subunit C [Spiroplasma sabaudiense Ar-1343]
MEMKKISPNLVKELANDIMLDISDDEALDIYNTESSLKKKFAKVLKINTDNVEPMYYPFETNFIGMREDEVMSTNNQKEVLANAPSTEGDFITIVKVVK